MEYVKVSFVMPVLNGMPYFEKALSSIMQQTLVDIEIIVVDAGSTDGTREFVAGCAGEDERIKLVTSKKKSMGAQYNLGISVAHGVYIGFCESDDYVDPDMAEKLYAIARKNDMPDAVKSDFYMFIDKAGDEFYLRYGVLPRHKIDLYGKNINIKDLPDLFFRDVNMWNGIFRREFLLENSVVLNETGGAAFQDTGFVHQVNMLAKRQIFVPYSFYHYRRDNDGSSVYKKETSRFAMQECSYMLKWFQKHTEIKKEFAGLSVRRIAGLFASLFGKNIYYMGDVSFKEELESFHKELCDFCNGIEFSQQSFILNDFWIAQFIYSLDAFYQLAGENYRAQHIYFGRIRKMLESKRCIVIMSAGELGQSICAFLNKNKYDGDLCFCDNDKKIQGNNVLGCHVYSVEDATHFYPDAAYFINPKYDQSLESQLISCGITRNQIVYPRYISPHTSMELDWSM